MRVIPVASGKGGVGKSLVSVNLSIALSQLGERVLLADLDLGASNAHTILGIRTVSKGIGNFLSESRASLSDFIMKTDYDGLHFLPGEAEIPGLANLQFAQKKRLMKSIFALQDYDYIIMDLGAGTGLNTLDFFLCSDEGLVVSTPSLTATLNAYLFLKNCIFRLMESSFPSKSEGKKFLSNLKKQGDDLQKLYLPKLFSDLKEADPENFEAFQKRFNDFGPRLILNMIEDPNDGVKAARIRVSCKEYLGIKLDHMGIIYRDHLQDVALNSRIPIIIYKPQSVISVAIKRLCEKIQNSKAGSIHTIDEEEINENFQLADIEAEQDFETRSEEIKDLLNSGVLSEGDLIETIRTQQYEIKSLKKENALLKNRLIKAVNQGFTF